MKKTTKSKQPPVKSALVIDLVEVVNWMMECIDQDRCIEGESEPGSGRCGSCVFCAAEDALAKAKAETNG
ncbi:MAG: hypothetical protein ABIP75_05570 [Pyrinomonadaceae bacterium]